MKARRMLIPILFLALGGCEGGDAPPPENVVARAAGVDFTAEETAEILAPQAQLPNQPDVVDALANLWIDYFLLARASIEDSTLTNVDVSLLVEQQANNEKVAQLREMVIDVDTAVSDAELDVLYEEQLPGGQLRARHILLQFPEGATPAQEDSVRALADTLRNRLLAGEDFAALAEEYSQDPGSAPSGGDLGSFQRGQMVPAFEEAAFALEPGEISDIVQTSFGLHIIRVEDRIVPPMEESRDEFRMQVQNQRIAAAESTYVADLIERSEIQVQDDAYEVAQPVVADPKASLSARAAESPLVSYEGGAYTLGEFQQWLQTRSEPMRAQLEAAPEDSYGILFQNLVRSELLLTEAETEGIEIEAHRLDSIAISLREGVQNVARTLGFLNLEVGEGETPEEVANRAVQDHLVQVVQFGQQVYPIGGFALALREQYDARSFQPGYERTVELVEELRAQLPASPPAGAMPPAPAPDRAADTTGGEG